MKRQKPGRLLLYGESGARLEREVRAGLLAGFVEAVLEHCGPGAREAWERSGLLTTGWVLKAWPESLAVPEAAILRSGKRFGTGVALQVEVEGTRLEEYADDMQRALAGERPPRRFDTRPAAEEDDPEGPLELVTDDPEVARELERELEREQAAARAAGVEVLPPGARRGKSRGRRWRLGRNDVFTVVGPLHPEDALDDTLEILREDLAWLNPGDRITSERRGRCRVVRVEDAGRQVVVRDAERRLLMLRDRELLAEFTFDDSEESSGPRRRPPR